VNPVSRILRNALAALGLARHTPPPPANEVYTRATSRFDADIPVLIGPGGRSPAAGTVVNISLQGAAVRIHDAVEWLAHLDQGDELRMTGLLSAPLPCWVVVVDGDLLRIHFAMDAAQRSRLFELIGSLVRH
jgi:hypothetical protein